MNFRFRNSNAALFVVVYLLLSGGCWLPGDDRHPDERGCQSDTSSGPSSPPPPAHNFTQPGVTYAGSSFRAVARADDRLWGFSIPANPELSITGPYELSVDGTAPVVASIDSTTAVAFHDGATVGFMTFDSEWAPTGAMYSFDADAHHIYLASDASGFFLLWAEYAEAAGYQATWQRISVGGDILASGDLALEGEPTGLVAVEGGFWVTWSASTEVGTAGISRIATGGEDVTIDLLRSGALSAPALHNGAVVAALCSLEEDCLLVELDLETLVVTERPLDPGLVEVAAMGSTDRGLLVLGSNAEQSSIVGYLEADGSLRSATELPPAADQDLATGAGLAFAVLQEDDRLTGYWTIGEETISTSIVLAENYTESGCQAGGHSPSTSIAALLLVLMFTRGRIQLFNLFSATPGACDRKPEHATPTPSCSPRSPHPHHRPLRQSRVCAEFPRRAQ